MTTRKILTDAEALERMLKNAGLSEVAAKTFINMVSEEERKTVMYLPVVSSNGKTATTILIPYYVHYPERYVIFIRAYQAEEWITEDFYVSKEVYDTVNIGDMFSFDKERGDLKDEPNTRERKS